MIVNADDFGYDANRNAAIVQAFGEGLISSTTIMATMPGFEEAAALAHERRLLDHVGVHLVLNEGQPLTDPIRRCRRFCDEEGRFVNWLSDRRMLHIGSEERVAVAGEARAQIARCRAAGLPLTHGDSHFHTHTEPAILRPVIGVLREARVPYLRLMQNRRPMSVPRRALVAAVNGAVRAAGLAATRGFGTYAELPQPDSFELMTHPVLDGEGRLVDDLVAERTLEELVPAPGTHASYSGARYA